MSWADQGRQEHGWFGYGTAPPKLNGPEGAAAPGDLFGRMTAAILGAVEALPHEVRLRIARAQLTTQAVVTLREAMMS